MFPRIKNSAFSLVEVIVSVALFSIFAAVLLVSVTAIGFDISNSADRLSARYLMQETQEALRSIRDYDWDELAVGTYGLDTSNGYWELSGSNDVFGKFTRSVVLTQLNTYRYEMDVTISWTTDEGVAQNLSSPTFRLTNWKALFFIIDTQANFDEGTYFSTNSIAVGSVQLDEVADNWDDFDEYLVEALGEQANEMVLVGTTLYIVSDDNGGEEFVAYDISDLGSGIITEIGAVEIGFNVNDIAVEGNYAFLATEDVDNELYIIDLLTLSLEQSFDLSGDTNANGIDVSGGTAVIVTDDQSTGEIFVVDVSAPAGTITEEDDIEYGSNLNDVEIDGGYAFVVGDDNASELEVLRLSNNTIQNTVNISGNEEGLAIWIDEDADIAYLGMKNSSNSEFIVIDISSPESFGTGDILGEEDVSNDVNDVHVVDGNAYLATSDGNGQWVIIDLSTYTLSDTINVASSGKGESIWFAGAYIFGGTDDASNGLYIIDSGVGGSSSAWEPPELETSDDLGGAQNMLTITIDGNYAYMGRDSNGTCTPGTGQNCEFIIYDISSPTSPSLEGALEIGDDVNDIHIDGDYAYLATDAATGELTVVDITTKSSPSIVGTYDTDSGANGQGVTGSGNYIYLSTADNFGTCDTGTGTDCEFYVIDIGDPAPGGWTSPSLLDSADPGNAQNMFAITIDGSYAYMGRDSNGSCTAGTGQNCEFLIYDISTPSSSTLVGALEIGADVNDVYVSGNYAYLATDSDTGELTIVDITTKSSPSIAYSYDTDSGANGQGVTGSGNFIYLSTSNNTGTCNTGTGADCELHVIDIGDSSVIDWTSPSLLDSDNPGGNQNMFAIIVDGNYAYMARDSNGTCNTGTGQDCEFLIYDISTPGAVSLEGALEIGSDVRDIYVNGNYAYLATHSNSAELTVVDITTKSSPSVTGSYNTEGGDNGRAITGSGNFVYIGTTENGGSCNTGNGNNCEFYVIDIGDDGTPSSPVFEGALEVGDIVDGLVLNGTQVYVANRSDAQEIISVDVSTPSSPVNDDTYNHPGTANPDKIAYDSTDDTLHVAFAANGGNGDYSIIDASTPTSLSLDGTIAFNQNNNAVALIPSLDLAFVTSDENNNEIRIIDISNTSSPSESTVLDLNGDGNDIFTDGTYMFIASENNSQEIQVVEPTITSSSPTNPLFEGAMEIGENTWDLVLNGTDLYVSTEGNSSELEVVDVSTPSSPSSAATYNHPGTANARKMAYDTTDDTLHMTFLDNGANGDYSIIDVSTPTSPSLDGTIAFSENIRAVTLLPASDLAFLVGDQNNNEFRVIDISNTSSPSEDTVLDLNADGNDIVTDGTYMFIASEHNSQELQVLSGSGVASSPSNPTFEGAMEIDENTWDLVLNGNYVYVSTEGNSNELEVVDISTPSSPSSAATYDHPGTANARKMAYDTTDNTLHMTLLDNGGVNGDYSIMDVSIPTSPSRLGTIAFSENINAVVLLPSDDLAFVAGDENNEEFRVIDISNTSSPSELSVLDLDGDGNDIATDGTYMFVASEHDSQELQVIGDGISAGGSGYATSGIYTSKKFDSTFTTTTWLDLEWTLSGTGGVTLQTRTASSSLGLDTAEWVGSDGTSSTSYSTSPSSIQIASGSTGTRYYQVRATITGDGTVTPLLEEIVTSYVE